MGNWQTSGPVVLLQEEERASLLLVAPSSFRWVGSAVSGKQGMQWAQKAAKSVLPASQVCPQPSVVVPLTTCGDRETGPVHHWPGLQCLHQIARAVITPGRHIQLEAAQVILLKLPLGIFCCVILKCGKSAKDNKDHILYCSASIAGCDDEDEVSRERTQLERTIVLLDSLFLFGSWISNQIQTLYFEEQLDKALKPMKRKVSTQDDTHPCNQRFS